MKRLLVLITSCSALLVLSGCDVLGTQKNAEEASQLTATVQSLQDENDTIKDSLTRMVGNIDDRLSVLEDSMDTKAEIDVSQLDANFKELESDIKYLADQLSVLKKQQNELIDAYNALAKKVSN